MQILELYIKGYNRLNGTVSTLATNKLNDTNSTFLTSVNVGDIATNLRTAEVATIVSIDNNTTLTLSDTIFTQIGEEYRIESEYLRADLFKDESITVTDSLLNIKDLNKIFTPFSQQFTLPASKQNNKLFRHYENTDVVNSFDARYRHDAIIKLNGIDYKKGKIQFKSVELKDNKAYSFKVVFFGDTVELKEVLGEDMLSSLQGLDALDFEYTYNNVKDKFINNSGDINFPLITHTKNMRYTNSGYRDNISNTELSFTDIKPAIRVQRVVQAINDTYPQINITGSLLNNPRYSNLHLWLHKDEGFMNNSVEGGETFILSNRFRGQSNFDGSAVDWTYNSGLSTDPDLRTGIFDAFTANYGQSIDNSFRVTLEVTSATSISYDIIFKRSSDNSILASFEDLINNQTKQVSFSNSLFGGLGSELDFKVEIQSESTLAISQKLTVEKGYVFFNFNPQETCVYNAVSTSVTNTINVTEQMPRMKVIDFLSNLFKMFNFVVYKEGDNMIVDDAWFFEQNGLNYDITKYVDMSKSTMERLFQYKSMRLNFKSKKSFLVQYSDELQNNSFSDEMYGNDEWDGGIYKIEVDFEKMMYERLSNEDTDVLTTIGQGAMLDKKFEPTIGQPLLLYIEQTNASGSFNLLDESGNATAINNYNRPTNLGGSGYIPNNSISLNFGIENDEYLQTVGGDGRNLFSEGYLDYVDTVFNPQSRLLKVSAYLPLSLITKYKMNDTFVINNKPYRINSVKTNLLTNKTDLELYNKQQFVSQIDNGQVAYLGRLAAVNEVAKGTTFVTLGWVPLPDPTVTGYSIYVDRGFKQTVGDDISGLTLTGMTSNTNYQIGVRVQYTTTEGIFYSNDTLLSVTTD
jgi:hypothetical protein